jgi:VanZ family protein
MAWVALLLVLTSIPNPRVPQPLASSDKLAHALLYGVLSWLVVAALEPAARTPRRLAMAFGAILALAWADEWHQQFIPGRSQSAADWLADGTGAALAILTASARRRREQPT